MSDNLPAVRQQAGIARSATDTDSWVQVIQPVGHLAERIADTAFVPKGLRGSAPAVAAAILYGREIGWGPMTSLAGVHVVDGRPTVSAELLRAMVLAAGHEITYPELSGAMVVARGRRAGSEEWTSVSWSLDMARAAGLLGKDNWKKYPRAMLVARATAELCRLIFPDVTHGLHATEELDEGGPADDAGSASAATTKVQRKTRTSKTDDGVASGDVAPAAAGAPAAPSSPPLPPLPGEPGFDDQEPSAAATAESDAGVAAAAQSADGANRVPAAPASTPDPPYAPEELDEHGQEYIPDPLPPEGDLPEPVEDITDPQRKKLFALMAEHGLKEKDRQIGWISKNLNREITSRAQVNKEDAKRLIDILEQLDATPRPISRGDLRLLGGLFDSLGITVVAERIHIASAIVGRTPMKEGQPSSEGLTAAEGKTLMEALGRCKTRDHVEALVQLAEQQRAQGGEE